MPLFRFVQGLSREVPELQVAGEAIVRCLCRRSNPLFSYYSRFSVRVPTAVGLFVLEYHSNVELALFGVARSLNHDFAVIATRCDHAYEPAFIYANDRMGCRGRFYQQLRVCASEGECPEPILTDRPIERARAVSRGISHNRLTARA